MPGFVGNRSPPLCQKPCSVPDGSITPTAQPSMCAAQALRAALSQGDDLRDTRGDASVYETEPWDEQCCSEATSWQSPQRRTRQGEVGLFSSTHGCLSSWKETGRWLSFCLQTLPEVAAVSRSFLVESEKSSTRDQLPPIRCCLCCPAPHSPWPRRAAAAQDEALPWWLFSSAARKEDMTPKKFSKVNNSTWRRVEAYSHLINSIYIKTKKKIDNIVSVVAPVEGAKKSMLNCRKCLSAEVFCFDCTRKPTGRIFIAWCWGSETPLPPRLL